MFKYEALKREHIEQVCKIEKECFAHPWNYDAVEQEACSPYGLYVAALDENGILVGYAGATYAADVMYISNIAVLDSYRRLGIGAQLVEELKKRAAQLKLSEITLEVRSQNESAAALYRKAGFKEMGKRKKYYTDPEDDAIIMNYELRKN